MRESLNNSRTVMDLVRRDRPLREPHFEAPCRGGRIFALALLVGMLVLSMYLFFHTTLLFRHFEETLRVDNGDTAKIRIYNEQLEFLQDRMTGFIAGSVENKLRTLEKSIVAGTVGTQEIRTLEELKNELKLLETYSAGKAGNFADQARLEHPRFQVAPPGSPPAVPNEKLLREVSQLKNLLYVSIASCGLIAALVGGYCWQHHSRAKRLQVSLAPLLTKNSSDEEF